MLKGSSEGGGTISKSITKNPLFISNINLHKSSVLGLRCYSSLNKKDALIIKKKSNRKTLDSIESKPYDDLYVGRGIPNIEPSWVKGNGMERSPLGASWAKYEKDRIHYPEKYPLSYLNIKDPYNNRKLIKETCRGNRVVYIWTYIPTGVCLVGSSSNSVERVLSYFEKKYLFLDKSSKKK